LKLENVDELAQRINGCLEAQNDIFLKDKYLIVDENL
jgi:hypothetical protein